MIHQAGRVAAAKSPPPAVPAASTAPITATPSAPPVCRLVEATAAATPAWARGIPEIAVLVIGALTRPKPMPKSTYPANIREVEPSAENTANSSPLAPMATPAISSGSRGPRVATSRPASGAHRNAGTAIGSM